MTEDEVITTKTENGDTTVETTSAEALERAIGLFLSAERRFQTLSDNPDKVTDERINIMWWDALERVYIAECTLINLFCGNIRTPETNRQYAKFRLMVLKGSSLKPNA